jgi:RnlB antitoxin of RnlAB toxin-antitoxin system
MKEYKVLNFDNEDCNNVILITSTVDVYHLQDEIYDDLSTTKGENFTILVDLFLRNGFSFNRFVSLQFKGKQKCTNYITNPREVSEDTKLEIRKYLKANTDLFVNSALTKSTINFVNKI